MRKPTLILPVVVPAMLLSGCNVLFRPVNNSTAANGSIFGNTSFDNIAAPRTGGGTGGGTTGNDLTADQGGSATPPGDQGGAVPGKPGADAPPQEDGGDQGSGDQGGGDQGGDQPPPGK